MLNVYFRDPALLNLGFHETIVERHNLERGDDCKLFWNLAECSGH